MHQIQQNLPDWFLIAAESGAECRSTSDLARNAIVRYTNRCDIRTWSEVRLIDFFGHFPMKVAGVDWSICKAIVMSCQVMKVSSQVGLAGVVGIELKDAHHSGVFISALFEAQPEQLGFLSVTCKRGGDCGCDHNAPYFGVLPLPDLKRDHWVELRYSCPQVRDLTSLAQWHVLTELNLKGCTSVEMWPDFAAMTSLRVLNLSNTSLKKWPSAVRLYPCLSFLDLTGCRELPAKELIMNGSTIAAPESVTSDVHLTCKLYSLASLSRDLRDGTRDRGSVADDLDALSLQLVLLFKGEGWLSSNRRRSVVNLLLAQQVVVEIMSPVWLGDFPELEEKIKALISATDKEWQYIRTEMRRLLYSKTFSEMRNDAFYFIGQRLARYENRLVEKEDNEVEAAPMVLLAGMGLKGSTPLVKLRAMTFECGSASVDRNCVMDFLQIPYYNYEPVGTYAAFLRRWRDVGKIYTKGSAKAKLKRLKRLY